MWANLKRGWFLFALTLGLFFQFFHFFRSQKIALNALTASDLAEALLSAPIAGDQRVMNNAQHLQQLPQFNQIQVRVNVANALKGETTNGGEPPAQAGPPVVIPATELSYDLQTPLLAAFDYTKPAVVTEFTLPPARRTNQSTVVICFSARDNFERRAAIRETWAKGNDNVYFVIGGPVPGNMEDMNKDDPLSASSLLFREQQIFGDLIDTIHPDTYKGLPYKLHFGVKWVMQNLENVQWIVKADDDVVVRVKLLEFFVLRKMNPFLPQVIGTVAVGAKPHRTGKWAEDPKFTDAEYPPWAFGSSGYVMSRPVGQYVADNDLYYYQGEDAGLGIWLAQSPLQTTWVDTPELRKEEGCHDKLYIIGHDLDTQAIRNCFGKLGDQVPDRKYIVAFTAGRKDQFPNRIRNPN